MTHRWRTPSLLLAAGVLALAAGCEDPPVETPAAPTPFDAAASKARAATEAAEIAAETAAPTDGAPASETPDGTRSDYAPPFPERLDLFSPPKQGARIARQTDGDSAESVVLLGFAQIDRPRVVLAIDDVVTPLAGGEEALGVKVISIAPPRAVLQRGRNRWTASIE